MAWELTVIMRFDKEEDVPTQDDLEWAFEGDVTEYGTEEV